MCVSEPRVAVAQVRCLCSLHKRAGVNCFMTCPNWLQVLEILGFGQARGHEGMPLPTVPKSFPQCDDFDMSRYFNEDESTPDFVTFVEVGLL